MYCVLYIVYCVLCIVYCLLHIVYCVLCIVYCVLIIVYCVVCSVYLVLCIVCCVFFVYCVFFSPNRPIGPIRSSSRNFCIFIYFYICRVVERVFFSVDRARIFAWTESAFWCGSLVSSRALKLGMCSGWTILDYFGPFWNV